MSCKSADCQKWNCSFQWKRFRGWRGCIFDHRLSLLALPPLSPAMHRVTWLEMWKRENAANFQELLGCISLCTPLCHCVGGILCSLPLLIMCSCACQQRSVCSSWSWIGASEQTNEGNGQTAEGAKKSSACTLWCSISIIIKSFLAFAKKKIKKK